MTIAATAAFVALFFRARKAGKPSGALGTTALTFAGAALMWGVDCAHAMLEGEPLLDLSIGDSLLGLLVIAAGLALFGALRAREWHPQAESNRSYLDENQVS